MLVQGGCRSDDRIVGHLSSSTSTETAAHSDDSTHVKFHAMNRKSAIIWATQGKARLTIGKLTQPNKLSFPERQYFVHFLHDEKT